MPKGIYKRRNLEEEHKKNISQGLKKAYKEGKRKNIVTEEVRKKISKSMKEQYAKGTIKHPMLGKTHSEEMKKRMREMFKGVTIEKRYGKEKAERIRKQIAEGSEGRIWTKESKEKASKSRMGFKPKKESIEKMAATLREGYKNGKYKPPMLGKKHSQESREKVALSLRGKYGKDSRNWMGGISLEPYNFNFNKEFKREIMNRDNQTCMVCGIKREELDHTLSIHHIDYDKQSSISQNCISLCKGCHAKTNGNRRYWTIFFQGLIKLKYMYSQQNKLVLKA